MASIDFGSGSGSGDGSGFGSGDGSGFGYGFGYGDGSGAGDVLAKGEEDANYPEEVLEALSNE